MLTARWLRGLAIGVAALGAVGCTDGPDVVPVDGTITRGGKPLASFAVTFQPTEGRPSSALSDEKGHFELSYTLNQKGALRGKHKVFVQFTSLQAGYDEAMTKPPPEAREIHAKYGSAEVTPLEVEIDGPKTLDLKLD